MGAETFDVLIPTKSFSSGPSYPYDDAQSIFWNNASPWSINKYTKEKLKEEFSPSQIENTGLVGLPYLRAEARTFRRTEQLV